MRQHPLKLLSSMAMRAVLAEILARYERGAAGKVSAEAAGGVDVAKRVRAGEVVDVVVLASTALDKLTAEGSLLAGSRVDLVKSGIAVAVPAGSPRPDLASEQAVQWAVRGARSLSYSTGPSGVHLEKVFARWGFLDEIRARIVVPPPGTSVASLIAAGRVQLGFQQLSELLNVAQVDVVGPLPPPLQSMTTFSGAVAARCSDIDGARALLEFVASPTVAKIVRRHGLEPV